MKGMKIMKKTTLTKNFIAIISAAAMTALSSTVAFANDGPAAGSKAFGNVTDKYDVAFNGTAEVDELIDVYVQVPTDTDGDGILDEGDGDPDAVPPVPATPITNDEHPDGIPDPVPDEAAEGTYKVVIEWEDMTFNYIGGQWNTETFTYDGGSWDKTSSEVTVTNYSNWSVDYAATFAYTGGATTEVNGVSAALSGNDSATLDAVAIGAANPNSNSFTIEIDADAVPTTNTKFQLGTITVALTPGTEGQA